MPPLLIPVAATIARPSHRGSMEPSITTPRPSPSCACTTLLTSAFIVPSVVDFRSALVASLHSLRDNIVGYRPLASLPHLDVGFLPFCTMPSRASLPHPTGPWLGSRDRRGQGRGLFWPHSLLRGRGWGRESGVAPTHTIVISWLGCLARSFRARISQRQTKLKLLVSLKLF